MLNYNVLRGIGWNTNNVIKRIPLALVPNPEFSAAVREKYPLLDIDCIIDRVNSVTSLTHRSYDFSI